MKFKTQIKITGAKAFDGSVDGTQHDFTKLFVETALSENAGVGYATVEYKWGHAGNFEQIKHMNFPFEAVAEMEIVTTGSRQSTIIRNISPLKA